MAINETTADNAWRMFRIMGEFAQGFEALDQLPKAIAVFGSARTDRHHPHYQAAREIARGCSERGFTVITGGGPGIMEAGNLGAHEAGGHSVGLCIRLPFEQSHNAFITRAVDFHYFFVRKVMFLKHTCGVVVMPGGFGTMDEFMETLTLIQTHKILRIPLVCYDRSFWQGLLDWFRTVLGQEHGYIGDHDLDFLTLADTPEEVFAALASCTPDEPDNLLANPA